MLTPIMLRSGIHLAGLTRPEFATLISMSERTLTSYVNGLRPMSEDVQQRIAKGLKRAGVIVLAPAPEEGHQGGLLLRRKRKKLTPGVSYSRAHS